VLDGAPIEQEQKWQSYVIPDVARSYVDYTGEVQTIPDQQMEDEIVTQIGLKVEKAKSATNAESGTVVLAVQENSADRVFSGQDVLLSANLTSPGSHSAKIAGTTITKSPALGSRDAGSAAPGSTPRPGTSTTGPRAPTATAPKGAPTAGALTRRTTSDAPSGPTTAAGASKERQSRRWRPFEKRRARLSTTSRLNGGAGRNPAPVPTLAQPRPIAASLEAMTFPCAV